MGKQSLGALIALAMMGGAFVSPAEAHLIVNYQLDGNALDSSGNGINGTVFGAVPTKDRFGNAHGAMYFDGDDYIRASASTLPTATRTVDFWFKADTIANKPVMLGYGGGACGTSWFMGLNATAGGGHLVGAYYVSSHCAVNSFSHPYASPPVGAWHNFGITTDPTGTRIYIDGLVAASEPDFINNTNVAGTDLALGVDVSPGGLAPYIDGNVDYFIGALDDVRIYDTALSADEMRRLGSPPVGTPEPASLAFLGAGLAVGIMRRRARA